MQNRLFGKNLFMVAFSRMVSLLSGIAVSFLLPKMLSVADYGYYKVFTLYAVYTALLHFGFADGILLKLAGKNYSALDREKMRAYTRFFIVFELMISLVIVLTGTVLVSSEYLFILIMLALNMVFVNITTYYQFIAQATQRFGAYSAKSVIVSLVKLLFVGVLFVIYSLDVADVSYRVYLIGLNLFDFLMAVWYVAVYSEITFGKGLPVRSLKKEIFGIFKTGIVLTVAYQVSHFILALDRQFVHLLYPTDVFAEYSFAYNIVSMISTMISSVSVVLLPMLKKHSKEDVAVYYKKGITVVSAVTAGALLCYFPLVPFVEWFLPNYVCSLEYVAIVLPTVLFTSGITGIMFTVEKVFDTSFAFFKNSCGILLLGLISNAIAYGIFRSPKAISYASLLVMAIWFLAEGISLGKRVHVRVYREFTYLAVISVGFLSVLRLVENPLSGFIAFGAVFAAVTLLFYCRRVN